MEVRLLEGGKHEDARGGLRFCNDFDLTSVKRFYTISNSSEHPQRGWIMHKREKKWFFPLRGKTEVKVEGREKVDSREEIVERNLDSTFSTSSLLSKTYTLDAEHPQVLCVPPGNWFLIEQDGTAEVQVFSNCFVGEFPNDDFRKEI